VTGSAGDGFKVSANRRRLRFVARVNVDRRGGV